jgi:hypothetical protein
MQALTASKINSFIFPTAPTEAKIEDFPKSASLSPASR